MIVTYNLTPDDLTAFALFHHSQSPALLRQKYGCAIIGFAAWLLVPALILLTSDKPFFETARDIWPLLLGPVLFLLFVFPYTKWRIAKLTKRVLAEGSNADFYDDCSLSLEVDGIHERKSSGESVRNWPSVKKIVVAPEHLFIYTSGVEAFVVPRRAFATSEECDQFVRQITERSYFDGPTG